MIRIGLFTCKAEADEGYRRGACIREVVEGVGGNGYRAGYQTRGILSCKQEHIQRDAQCAAQAAIGFSDRRIRYIVAIFDEKS